MGTDLLGIGSSALLAYRTALDVVGQNIANASTPGYSRQNVDLQNRGGLVTPTGDLGTGVQVTSVQRLSNGYVQQQLVEDDSSYNRLNTFQTFSSQVDSTLSGSSSGLSTPLQGFFSAINTLTSGASSASTRQALIASGQTLTLSFNTLQQQLNDLDSQVSGSMSTTVGQINGYAQQLAKLNLSISQATATGDGQQPNDLLDQRDQLLRNISSDVGISSTTNADGSVNVFVANGQALVLGVTANSLSVQPDTFGKGQDIVINGGGSSSIVTPQISGGTLGGLLDTRSQVIDPAMNQLGQLAATLSVAMNAQNAKGMNQYGQLGGNFFTPPQVAITGASTNTGSGTVSATITNTCQLTTSDYVLKYDGSSWSMINQSTGASVALSGAGTAANPFTAAGLQIVVGGSPAAGDQYLVQPTHDVAGAMQMAISDPAMVAAATPVQSAAAATNNGSATISTPQVLDPTNPNLLSATTIQFTGANTYSINGAGSYSYTNGGNIPINGVQVQISGVPAAGDSFTLSANTGTSSDNTNAKAMAAIANQTLLNGGVDTLASANATMVTQFGSQAQQAQSQLTAETAIRSQDQTQRDAVSGVNLDEEAASMIQFQQAYQAAAQIISTSQTLFQSLITALNA
ncbi:MAG: flagellar hook-associated protein FlgK [Nevskia sp.]|nr:flagellar hook-associated protein FlgK [Nevskia sp.]